MPREKVLVRTRVNVKLVPGTRREQAERLLGQDPGVLSVEQLFPDERDDEMRQMYMLEVDGDAAKDTVSRLVRNPVVEYAHESASRNLIW